MKIFVDIPENKECQHLKVWFKKHEECNLRIIENAGSLAVKCPKKEHKASLNMSAAEWKRLGVRFIIRPDEQIQPKKIEAKT